ncbi:MAG: DUF4339 domain-containing protein [Treponema sp.]|nr:DUF4339 domain-containing protein [Treponema sp.]MCL2212007.1 DUF4339 domain-containing protein [Treponema sp.]
MSDFYSSDKLVEFGMSMGIAQQLVKTMNEVLKNMYVPGAMNPMHPPIGGYNPPAPVPQVFYAMLDGKQSGPYSETECSRLINEKKIVKETYIWMPGMNEWKTAENTPAVLRLAALAPPEFKPHN